MELLPLQWPDLNLQKDFHLYLILYIVAEVKMFKIIYYNMFCLAHFVWFNYMFY